MLTPVVRRLHAYVNFDCQSLYTNRAGCLTEALLRRRCTSCPAPPGMVLEDWVYKLAQVWGDVNRFYRVKEAGSLVSSGKDCG